MPQTTPASVVVDTNILSYILNDFQPLASAYTGHLQGTTPFVALETVAEMRFGAERNRWGTRRKTQLEAFLSRFTTIYPTDAICQTWARLRTQVERSGCHIDSSDAWIAATALELGVPLMTHNIKDFDAVKGLTLISERDA